MVQDEGTAAGNGMRGLAGEAEADDGDTARAPWWAWGFVAAMPTAFLALVTPWFAAASPRGAETTASYGAWTNPWFGIIAPMYLLLAGGQWFGALRERWRPPAPRDWRGFSRAVGFAGASYVPLGTASGKTGAQPAALTEPMRTGARLSAAYGVAALVLLGVNRALFQPTYVELDLASGLYQHGNMLVHPAFGCWCLLLSAGLFLCTGLLGAALPEPRTGPV